MLLDILFFSVNDILLVPVCIIILYAILRNRAKNCKDEGLRSLYYKAFYFKIICVFAYTLFTEFYFGGGDTNLYYQGIKDLRAALSDDFNYLSTIISSSFIDEEHSLAPYFLYDNYQFDITFNYMRSPSNFFIPRLGLIFSLIFFNSYICISLCFAFFALGGSLRLFKLFYYYYPNYRKELAIAILFLPSVGFWSSGLLKDTICFGCVGYFVYGIFNLLVRKKNTFTSLIWIVITGYLLYVIKTYIFLVLVMAVLIWIFAETNKLIKEKTLRQVFALMTFIIAGGVGFFLLQYITSAETLRQYQFENIVSSAEYQRNNYEALDRMMEGQSSYYSVNTSNPVLLIFNSIVATFFRPFIWEIRSGAAILSAIEALIFGLLTVKLIMERGSKFFSYVVKDPRILMSFIFAIVFAIGVGISTANFGALSRYKIPCMPFYMVTILLIYRNSGLAYPRWFSYILNRIKL